MPGQGRVQQVLSNSLLKNPNAPGNDAGVRRFAGVRLRPGTPSAARRTWTKPGTAGVSQQAASSGIGAGLSPSASEATMRA